MSETAEAPKTTTAKGRSSRSAKTSAAPSTNPFMDFEAFSMPKMEVPEMFREATEKGIAQARDTYAKMKSAAEEATDMMEDTLETSRLGAVEFNHKAVDAAKTNTDATFSFMKDMMATKSIAEAIELQSSFARQQFDALSAQAKDMQEFARKLGTDVSAPFKSAVEKSVKEMKSA